MSPLLQSTVPGLALGTYSAADPATAPPLIRPSGHWGPWLAGVRYVTGTQVQNAFDGGQYIALKPSLGVRPDTDPASWFVVGTATVGGVATYAEGTAAARPAAGVKGRIYYATDTQVYSVDTGVAWNLLPVPLAEEPYGAQVARTSGTEYEPSAIRRTFVVLEAVLSGEATITIEAGGVKIGELSTSVGNPWTSLGFPVAAGKKWKATSGIGAAVLKSTYFPL